MSAFNSNQLERAIQLDYRTAPTPAYYDPAAKKLALAATILASVAWLICWVMELAPQSMMMLVLSLTLGVIATICVVGAMLDHHIPPLAWLAAACLLCYWPMIVRVGFKSLFATIMSQ
jgi:hypothetical protein